VIPAQRDLALPDPWEKSLERSRRKRVIIPELRRRQNRRRRASAALSTLMVAGPASQVFAAATAAGAAAAPGSRLPATRAIGELPTGAFFRVGSTGEAVRAIQARLGLPADGVYGVATERAVRAFQARSGLGADGVVGPVTWTRLMGLGKAALRAGAGDGEVAVIVRERPNAPANPARRAPARTEARHAAAPAREEGRPSPRRHPSGAPDTTAPDSPTPDAGRQEADPAPKAPGVPQARTRPVASPTPAPNAGSGACGELRLSAPVDGVKTSPYGPRGGRNHNGIDIAAPSGTPIKAAECGVVSSSGAQGGYGNMVCVNHSSALQTCYAHMLRTAASTGQSVRKGQVIGYVGSTGNSTGPHVHFETRVKGQARDPEPYLRGGAVPGRPAVRQATATRSTKAAASRMAGTRAASSPALRLTASHASSASTPPPAAARRATAQPAAPAPTAQRAEPAAQPAPAAQPGPAPAAEQAPPITQPTPAAQSPAVEQAPPTTQPTPAAQPVPPAPATDQAAPAAQPTPIAQPAPAAQPTPIAQPAPAAEPAEPTAQPTPAAQPTTPTSPQPAAANPQGTPPQSPNAAAVTPVEASPAGAD